MLLFVPVVDSTPYLSFTNKPVAVALFHSGIITLCCLYVAAETLERVIAEVVVGRGTIIEPSRVVVRRVGSVHCDDTPGCPVIYFGVRGARRVNMLKVRMGWFTLAVYALAAGADIEEAVEFGVWLLRRKKMFDEMRVTLRRWSRLLRGKSWLWFGDAERFYEAAERLVEEVRRRLDARSSAGYKGYVMTVKVPEFFRSISEFRALDVDILEIGDVDDCMRLTLAEWILGNLPLKESRRFTCSGGRPEPSDEGDIIVRRLGRLAAVYRMRVDTEGVIIADERAIKEDALGLKIALTL